MRNLVPNMIPIIIVDVAGTEECTENLTFKG